MQRPLGEGASGGSCSEHATHLQGRGRARHGKHPLVVQGLPGARSRLVMRWAGTPRSAQLSTLVQGQLPGSLG